MKPAITRLPLIALLTGLTMMSSPVLPQSATQDAKPQIREQAPYGRYLMDR